MYQYAIGIIAAFASAILHSGTNILESFFSNKIFNKLSSLIFLSAVVELIFLPLVFIFNFPHMLSLTAFAVVICISLITVLYSYPYYWALRHSDTSVVISLFSLGKIIVPILAFAFLAERLNALTYVGFFLVIASSFFLTFDIKKFKFNKAFFLMLLASVLISVQAILYKYLFDSGVSWGSAVVWTNLFTVVIAGIVVLFPQNIADLKPSVQKAMKISGWFLASECLDWFGEAANSLAIFLIPVSIVKGITSTQSIFVLILALLFSFKLPHLFKEYIGKDGVWKKLVFFTIIIIGTIMITSG